MSDKTALEKEFAAEDAALMSRGYPKAPNPWPPPPAVKRLIQERGAARRANALAMRRKGLTYRQIAEDDKVKFPSAGPPICESRVEELVREAIYAEREAVKARKA